MSLGLSGLAALLLAALLWLSASGVAEAKGSPAPPPPPTLDDVLSAFPNGMTDAQLDAVLGVMSDTTLREGLRKRLIAEMAARREAATAEGDGLLKVYAAGLRALPAAYMALPDRLDFAFSKGGTIPGATGALRWVGAIAVIIGVGAIGMLIVHGLLRPVRRHIREQAMAGTKVAIGALVLRFLLDLVEIAAFLAASALTYAAFEPTHPAAPQVLSILLRSVVVVLLVSRLTLFFCDTRNAGMRLLTVDDAAARALYRVVLTTTLLAVGVTCFARVMMALGLDMNSLVALVLPLSLLPFLYLIALAWRHRATVAQRARHWLTLDNSRRVLLDAWPVFLTAYLSILWLVIADGILRREAGVAPRALESLLLLLSVPLLAWLIHRPLARFYGVAAQPLPGSGLTATGAEPPSSAVRQVQRLMRAVWFVLIVGAIILTAKVWGFEPDQQLGIGSYVFSFLFDVGVVLLLGYVGWALIVRSIDRALENAKAGGSTTKAQRLTTLLPLLRKFLQVTLALIIVMIVLASLGVEIGPLLAGAGVVGIAIGLGAQQTIADILAGIFFLLEDSFRIGDYVEVGSLKGQVESISLRSMKLRHQRGQVHTLPFGQMKSLTNYNRDWALIRLEFRVTPDTDLDLVKRLVKNIAKELEADPALGPGFIQPLKSQGIRNVEDGALVIGIKYIAKPGTQFLIRKAAYEKLIAAFRENNIEIVGRGVVVRVESGDQTPPEAIGAAAAHAIGQPAAHD
jgi:small-conductance mechanosensitive channel